MTEVGGDAAVYIDPDNVAGAAVVVAKSLEDRERIRRLGLASAAHYSRRTMMDAYIACYSRASGTQLQRRSRAGTKVDTTLRCRRAA